MRIFYAGQISPQASCTSSSVWEINILNTLKKNHDVLIPNKFINIFDVTKNPKFDTKSFKIENSYKLLREVEAAHKEKKIDLFFSYFYSENIVPEIITKIRNLGIPTANIYFNSVHQFSLVKDIAPYFDYSLFPEKDVSEKYKKIGANPIRFPMAANPDFYKKYDLIKDYDVVFIGSDYLNRRSYVEYLYSHGINVHVFGPNWINDKKQNDQKYVCVNNLSLNKKLVSAYKLLKKRELHELKWLIKKTVKQIFIKIQNFIPFLRPSPLPASHIHAPLSDDDMIRMFSRAKIVLNLSETFLFDSHERGGIRNIIKLRDFEVPMCGGFAITGCQRELHDYYSVGTEIICYKNKRDLLKKVRYYLANEKERESISMRAYKRAQKDHTWERRFNTFFKEIKLT